MMYIFQNTLNTRSIIEDSFKYIRSDVPTIITENEKDFLLSNDITTIVDLRTDKERVSKRCPLIDDNRFDYYVFPILDGDKIPGSTNDVSKSYISMVDTRFNTMIEFLLKSKSNVLYFCNAGKDRTGVVSAVLLHKLGVEKSYIICDYMKSRGNLMEVLTSFSSNHPEIDINVITPHKKYIEEFIDWYIANN